MVIPSPTSMMWISCEYVFRKPNPLLFELALKKAGLPASDVWFCGDNMTARIDEDVLGITLPKALQNLLQGYSWRRINSGMSQAEVYRIHSPEQTLYLKTEPLPSNLTRERGMLEWLATKAPVASVKQYCEADDRAYLLVSEVPGIMCCTIPDDDMVKPYEQTIKCLADGLLLLQSLDLSNYPFQDSWERKMAEALSNIEDGLVDMEDWNDDTDFASPRELYNWLYINRPVEELCFTHGDYCLPNIMISGGTLSGFIDLGGSGVADKWQDIALCVRSLNYNLRHLAPQLRHEYTDLLFTYLGAKPDEEKLRYYILLDELF